LAYPVRAGMVSDPADYRWSGYAEAIGKSPSHWKNAAILWENNASHWKNAAILWENDLI
jgi:hypothetical protein